jgi:hypothetical protein
MENKIDYIRPAVLSLFIGLLLASFSQSCSSTKASISRYILPVRLNTDNLTVKPVFKPLEERSVFNGMLDTPVKDKPVHTLIQDTTNYNRMILDNQQLSLLNEKKIIDMLMSEKRENKKLKAVNNVLAKKSEISQELKDEALSMKTLWDLGNMILVVSCAVLGLFIIQNIFLYILLRKKRSQSL